MKSGQHAQKTKANREVENGITANRDSEDDESGGPIDCELMMDLSESDRGKSAEHQSNWNYQFKKGSMEKSRRTVADDGDSRCNDAKAWYEP